MPLTVSARKNTLVGRNSSYRFHTTHGASVGYDELVDIMSKARTTLSKPDIVACMTLMTEIVSDLVADGKFVKTPLGDFYLSAIGTIDHPEDSFNPGDEESGHGVRLRFRPDRQAEATIGKVVRVRRDDTRSSRNPHIIGMETIGKTGEDALEPGDLLRLRGYRLAFDATDESQGVFLALGERVPITRCSVYANVEPSLLILQLPPNLEPGDYTLIVRTATATGTSREARMEGLVKVKVKAADA